MADGLTVASPYRFPSSRSASNAAISSLYSNIRVPSHITDPATRKDADTFYGGAIEILSAVDIASLIVYAVTAPEHVSINEVLLRPLRQS
jgi:NADP-dependent 3-hydroxy acid dehydrogenase YdfG